eukprot:458932-Pyramimonas_sp.AAC.1
MATPQDPSRSSQDIRPPPAVLRNGRGADSPWVAAVANPDAYPMDESDIRRADSAMHLEEEIHRQ